MRQHLAIMHFEQMENYVLQPDLGQLVPKNSGAAVPLPPASRLDLPTPQGSGRGRGRGNERAARRGPGYVSAADVLADPDAPPLYGAGVLGPAGAYIPADDDGPSAGRDPPLPSAPFSLWLTACARRIACARGKHGGGDAAGDRRAPAAARPGRLRDPARGRGDEPRGRHANLGRPAQYVLGTGHGAPVGPRREGALRRMLIHRSGLRTCRLGPR